MTYEFFPSARAELFEAVLYYEEKDPGLGLRFRNEIYPAISTILKDPFVWRERAAGYRRVNLPAFPYHIAYIVERDVILIVAIAHSARKPNYWIGRLSP